jgi:trk system potassium uptake protein TrkA
VVVVDVEEEAFHALSAEFTGFRVAGDATELDVLGQAQMEKAQAVVVTTGDDNVNLMVAQVAGAVFGVKQAIARVSDPGREPVYQDLGIQTVSPTQLAADMAVELLSAAVTATEQAPP